MTQHAMVACEVNAYRTTVRFHLPNPLDPVQKTILQQRAFHERGMLEDVGSSLPEDALVVDVGAHIGNHTLFFSAILGARTLAIEPNPAALAVLRANIETNGMNKLVEILPAALGAVAGEGTIVSGDPSNTGAARIEIGDAGDIPVMRLDDIVGDHHVHLIKIDVNGMEADVLCGAAETIARCRPKLLVNAATTGVLSEVETVLR